MSWATYSSTIYGALTGYRRIPENKKVDEAPISHNHKAYFIEWTAMNMQELHTNNNISYSHQVHIEVKYENLTTDEYDTNVDLWITLLTTIAGKSGFMNFATEPTLSFIDNKHIKGVTEFYFGADGLC